MIIDTNRNTFTRLAQLKAAGVTTVIRYIAAGLTAEEKVIKPGEAHAIADAGMRLGLVYEIGGKPSGAQTGQRDGVFAHSYAPEVGAPDGAIIWYTVDYDAGQSDMPGIIAAFKAFRAAITPKFRVGCYGSGFVCAELKKAGLIDARWLTDSLGFRGTRDAIAAGEYEMVQGLPQTIAGLDADPNKLRQAGIDIGDFIPFAPAGKPPAPPPVTSDGTPATPPLNTDAIAMALSGAQAALAMAKANIDTAAAELAKAAHK